jgi:hypothetical protein
VEEAIAAPGLFAPERAPRLRSLDEIGEAADPVHFDRYRAD